jgi:hypothetical protein
MCDGEIRNIDCGHSGGALARTLRRLLVFFIEKMTAVGRWYSENNKSIPVPL